MRFLARFAMRGPFFAAATAAALQLGSLSVGILLILSGGIIALTTLRRGARDAAELVSVSLGLAKQRVYTRALELKQGRK